MKQIITSAWVLLYFPFLSFGRQASVADIIPEPNRVETCTGSFTISRKTSLVAVGADAEKEAAMFNYFFKRKYGFTLKGKYAAGRDVIRLAVSPDHKQTVEAYRLRVGEHQANIAGGRGGVFYGIQSLIQLIRADGGRLFVPVQRLTDAPNFAYRGLMLDVARHFFDPDEIKKVLDVMASLKLNRFHWHLTDDQGWRLIIPDSRQRNGTLRFWEAQYDVMLGDNMISSPHGWSAWRPYATYYLYLLTGKKDYLLQTMNALGACVQTIDAGTGHLRWAFVVDPYVPTVQSSENFPNTGVDSYNANQFKAQEGRNRPRVIGEAYVDMVSGWFHANSSDNDVHEIFKCMDEVVLGNAYILEEADGGILAYNCRVVKKGSRLYVTSGDDSLVQVHLNLKNYHTVAIAGWQQRTSVWPGRTWLHKTETAGALKQ